MKKARLMLLLLFALAVSAQAGAQDEDTATDTLLVGETPADELQVQVKGFLDTYHAARTEGKGEWLASRTRARGELTLEKGGARLFVSMNAIYNALLKEQTGITLREAYLSYANAHIDLRAGRQIIIWGVADALRLTDQISPMDYTEFLAQDYDDIRTPVNAFRLRLVRQAFNVELVCIPVSDFFTLPTDERNPWAAHIDAPMPYTFDLDSRKPKTRLRNVEFGGRFSVNLSGIDFSFCGLHTWNKMPAFSYAVDPSGASMTVVGHYRRLTMFGADVSFPIGRFVVRGELAANLNEVQNAEFGSEVQGRNVFNALLGVDWYAGNDWMLSAQYAHKHVGGSIEGLSVLRNTGVATVRVSKELFRNTLALSSFAYIDVSHGGVFNRLSCKYDLNDQISLTAGYDYFHADAGMFAMYSRNSEVWVKLKYGF